ncbi:MAG: FAD-dependent thymidylate synthase [Actinobacteria bacterium]|nr:FAD-dependent thymidylate synthase [Actinomycetota bacterium]
MSENFTERERAVLAPHFTNLDGPVFALVNLPEVVKGALFARYSRSGKSLRRLFLDEFAEGAAAIPGRLDREAAVAAVGVGRAEQLYDRVFLEYGDDSVAQLGAVHLACEGASQLLAKVLERGRLAAYLEQSTRYVAYDDRPGDRWRYHVPTEILGEPDMADRYRRTADLAFETYSRWLGPLQDFYRHRFPKDPGDSDFTYRMTIRARACDALRGLLPAATTSNVGIFATAQSYEHLLLRMRADPLAEVREYADLMLMELRKVIAAFLTRVDRADRGERWTHYFRETREATARRADAALIGIEPDEVPEVSLTDFDPDGEAKVVAAALYASTGLSDEQLLDAARKMTPDQRVATLDAYVGDRVNRRHKPGRAFERTSYRFDVMCDYGAFRDLQRHRPLTIEWQALSPDHGFERSPDVEAAGAGADWDEVMSRSAELFGHLVERGMRQVAPYAVSMAYRIRFVMEMNAREAMHVLELRTTPQGHPAYRRVCQHMHRLIGERAGHRAIAEAMRFVDHTAGDEGRLEAERRTEARRSTERREGAGRAANPHSRSDRPEVAAD